MSLINFTEHLLEQVYELGRKLIHAKPEFGYTVVRVEAAEERSTGQHDP